MEIRKVQRDTIGDCRIRENNTFYRIASSRGGPRTEDTAYNKIDTEIAKIKDKVYQAQKAKNLLGELFDDDKALTFRDFYKAKEDDDDSDKDDLLNSEDEGIDE